MKVFGAHFLPFPPETAYEMMQDPKAIARAIPGCQELEKVAESEYRMKMNMVLGGLSGSFDGKVRIADQNPFSSFRLAVEGSGRIGFMKGEGLLKLAEVEGGSEVRYEGEAQIGGTIAAVGQRLLDGTAKLMIRKFFEKLADPK
jgi:uncharacterized protein